MCAFKRTTDNGNVIPRKVRALGCMVNAANISAKSVDFFTAIVYIVWFVSTGMAYPYLHRVSDPIVYKTSMRVCIDCTLIIVYPFQ